MKMKKVDIAVTALFVAAMVVIFLFWKCHLDPSVAIIAAIIVVAAGVMKFVQYKKLKELGVDDEEQKQD